MIELTEEEEEEYWMVVSAVFEGKETSTLTSEDRSTSELPISTPLSDPINNKVSMLLPSLTSTLFVKGKLSSHCLFNALHRCICSGQCFNGRSKYAVEHRLRREVSAQERSPNQSFARWPSSAGHMGR